MAKKKKQQNNTYGGPESNIGRETSTKKASMLLCNKHKKLQRFSKQKKPLTVPKPQSAMNSPQTITKAEK